MSSENRPTVPNSLNEHWMPFTSNKDFKANPRLITEAKGVYLKTHHGKTQIDGSSGLFCNPLGHGRREITEAVTKQLETLDYACLLYTSPSPRDPKTSRMPSSA